MGELNEIIVYHPEFCTLETSVSDLKYILSKYNYDELVIVDLDHHPLGIVTKEAISDEALMSTTKPFNFNINAQKIMQTVSATAPSDISPEECLKIMQKNHLTAIPVVNQIGQCIGVVREFDLENKIKLFTLPSSLN